MKVTTETIKENKVELTADDLLVCVKEALGLEPETFLDIKIKIPGGGDWSNMTVRPEDLEFQASWTEKNYE